MIVKLTKKGKHAFIDNYGEVNGKVKVEGDPDICRHLNYLLNEDINLPYGTCGITDKRLIYDTGKVKQLYKASDVYIENYFLRVEAPALGYEVEVMLKEKFE